jgi:ABC-2 type transport system ATP-binding protein
VGSLVAVFDGGGSRNAMNDGLRALADAEVPVLAFEIEGARLNDAFLAMTEEA